MDVKLFLKMENLRKKFTWYNAKALWFLVIESLYKKKPKGFVVPRNKNKVYKLLKSLFGLKTSAQIMTSKL